MVHFDQDAPSCLSSWIQRLGYFQLSHSTAPARREYQRGPWCAWEPGSAQIGAPQREQAFVSRPVGQAVLLSKDVLLIRVVVAAKRKTDGVEFLRRN